MEQDFIFDVHSHAQFPAYNNDREAVIGRAKSAGVKMIAVGTQVSTSSAGIRLAREYPEDIWAAVGYHPNHAVVRSGRSAGAADKWHHDPKEQARSEPEKFDIKKLKDLAKDPKVVAIGECGLDYYRLVESENSLAGQAKVKSLQKEVFLQQIELAKELNKPLMIHCRPSKGTDDAYEDLLSMLQETKFSQNIIIHFYVGSLKMTRKFLGTGFYPHTKRAPLSESANGANARSGVGVYFTFGGVITFARDYDESIKYIPLDRILLETDCPYVAPMPYRGKRNEPAYIIETAKKMAEIKNVPLGKLVESVYENTLRVFNF